MRVLLVSSVLWLVGCFSPSYHNGNLHCGASDPRCPDGYHCAGDNTCWLNGQDPDPCGGCPNGFACSNGACNTSCSAPSDCQPNFACNAPNCERVPESDCLDGVDNNGDGLADCADPTCINTQVTCAPVATTPVGAAAATCPAGVTPIHINQGFQVPTTCHGCGCTVSGTCTYSFYGDQSGAACVNPNFFLGSLSSSSGGACFTLTSPTQYYSIYTSAAASATCGNQQSGVPDAPSYATSESFCPSAKSPSNAGCGANQACVALPSTGKVCTLVDGASCPASYPNTTSTWYADGVSSDDRACSCTGCTVTNNGSCALASLQYITHCTANTYAVCTDNPAPYNYCSGGCCGWPLPGTTTDGYWLHTTNVDGFSAHVIPPNTGATCNGGPGTVTGGTAMPGATLTVCCQ
jgi:hypothetical protein